MALPCPFGFVKLVGDEFDFLFPKISFEVRPFLFWYASRSGNGDPVVLNRNIHQIFNPAEFEILFGKNDSFGIAYGPDFSSSIHGYGML